MTMFVVDSSGRIVNAIELDDGAEWSPPEGFIVVSGDYVVGGTLIDGVYTPPIVNEIEAPAPVLSEVIGDAKRAVIALADSVTAQVTAQYPQSEVASWPVQLREAQLVLALQALPEPALLPQFAAIDGSTLQDIAAAVIAKAKVYNSIVAVVQGLRNQAEQELDAARSVDDVPVILAGLRDAAAAQAQKFGLTIP